MDKEMQKIADLMDSSIKRLGEVSAKLSKGTVSESIFSGKTTIIPMADVQNIEKHFASSDCVNPKAPHKKGDLVGYSVITKHTKWDSEMDYWGNNIYLGIDEGEKFLQAWRFYRHELEISTLKNLPE